MIENLLYLCLEDKPANLPRGYNKNPVKGKFNLLNLLKSFLNPCIIIVK